MPRLIFRHPQPGCDQPSVPSDSYAAAAMRAAGWLWREEAEAESTEATAAAESTVEKPRRRRMSEDG
jgi:hypothetical protein